MFAVVPKLRINQSCSLCIFEIRLLEVVEVLINEEEMLSSGRCGPTVLADDQRALLAKDLRQLTADSESQVLCYSFWYSLGLVSYFCAEVCALVFGSSVFGCQADPVVVEDTDL